ncbi:hypothetical protein D3C73_1666860 [compost metagenome]
MSVIADMKTMIRMPIVFTGRSLLNACWSRAISKESITSTKAKKHKDISATYTRNSGLYVHRKE